MDGMDAAAKLCLTIAMAQTEDEGTVRPRSDVAIVGDSAKED